MNNAEHEYMNKGPPIIELATRLLLYKCYAKSSFSCLLSQWLMTNSNMGLLNCSTVLQNVNSSFRLLLHFFYLYHNISISSVSLEDCIKSKQPF